MPDTNPRADLGALRIHREEDAESRGGTAVLGKIVLWIIILAIAGALGYVVYQKWIVPTRAPIVETLVVKPSVNVANPPLLTASGYLVASRTAKITPKISGKVMQLNVDTGVNVKKGDVIAVLESTNLQAQLDEANASLNEAQREYDRQVALWNQGVTSRALYDSADAQLKTAKARVNQIRINMQDMVVRAPFDGTVASKSTEVGEVISSVMMGQVAGTLPTGAICTLVDLKTIEVEADVNEQSISQLHEGQAAEVTVDAFPNRKWKGQLRQIIPTADRAKAIVKVKVAIINPDAPLLPEMAANVSFLQAPRSDAELQEPAKLWLAPAAIVDGKVAVIDADKHVSWKRVTTGEVREGRIEVTSGIKEGDRVVLHGADALKENQLVRLNEG
ncbi:MAG TPA: efflux RND transporter periplasmic adaptor subunit [Thermoanaerobaculia bacterium]|nr:efflux RND transporter periplasmic adaptor subunit [Thermoanaerobaculia bacterium]